MKIAIGADHRGFLQKEFIKKHMRSIEWVDVGTYDTERTDYPIFADKVVQLMLDRVVSAGVLLCASGGGMAIAANRYKYIYAVVAWNNEIARQSKLEDNANVLVLPSDFVSWEDAVNMIDLWLAQEFKGGRYAERIAMLDK
jgi:ribose 5-phosphate isomerase B